jgi:hypothetical protein
MTTVYKYIGRGDAFYLIPARDLTEEDMEAIKELPPEFQIDEEKLISSGLYQKIGAESVIETTETEEQSEETKAPRRGKAKKDGE